MKFSNSIASLRMPWRAYQRAEQAVQDGPQVVAPVEEKLHLGEVAVGVFGELDGVVRVGERC
jgi:hypothetical protein